MKLIRSTLAAAFAMALLSSPARAVTFQVVDDTAGTPPVGAVAGKITKTAVKATTLPVSAKSNAYLFFDVANSQIDPNAVTAARLVIFFPKVTKPGNLTLFANGSAFSEIIPPPATTIPTPTTGATIGAPLAVIVADTKNFFTIDVTAQVKSWLTNAGTDFGFGISADSPTSLVKLTIGSKEGSGSGYPAVLEVDVNDSGGTVSGTNVTFTGPVGIGTPTPTNPLNVALGASEIVVGSGSSAASIALELTNTNNGSGFGGAANAVGIGFDGGGGIRQAIVGGTFSKDFLDFYTGGDLTTPKLHIDNNVGIGTLTPTAKLEVNGTAKINGTSIFGSSITQNLNGGNFSFISSNGSGAANAQLNVGIGSTPSNFGIISNTNGPLIFSTFGSIRMQIDKTTGNVGIGTTTPTQAKLVVNGTFDGGSGGGGNFTNAAFINGNNAQVFVGGNAAGNSLSIFASGDIAGGRVFGFSDARIKKIEGRSDAAQDLALLRRLEITDYRYKDVIAKGDQPQKKVIAQQVEKIFPQAVGTSTNVVPDIYQKAAIQDGWVLLATNLQVGERVRLIDETHEDILEVREVAEGCFRTDFQGAAEVFVYGREVKDFRTVDYDAIAMLNVSATQELAKKLEAKDAELNQLRAAHTALREKFTALEAADQAREARLTRLEAQLAPPEATARTAALTANDPQ